jgi:hypothetical protein
MAFKVMKISISPTTDLLLLYMCARHPSPAADLALKITLAELVMWGESYPVLLISSMDSFMCLSGVLSLLTSPTNRRGFWTQSPRLLQIAS